MEDRLRAEIKKDIVCTVISLIIDFTIGLITFLYALNYNESVFMLFVLYGVPTFCLGYFLYVVVTDVVPLYKDCILYKTDKFEKTRAEVLSKKKISKSLYSNYFKIEVKDLETGKKLFLETGDDEIKVNGVYDFLYTKHSVNFVYELVPDEELIQQRREKAGKIESDQTS